VTNASHELRTPLSVIRENVSLIEDGVIGTATDQQKGLLKVSRLNVDRLASILDRLLDISKIESRSLELKRERVDLSLLAARAAELMQSKAAEKKISIEADIPEKLMSWIDQEQILQVFVNLLDNAIKYSNSRGRITIGLEPHGNQIRAYVADNGIGIDEADQEKIFERFVRLNDDASSPSRGTGLGLSICNGIVEMHGGRLWVESQLGRGSKFIFTLPRMEI
jgi:signal transduction histidine kinase